MVNLWVAAFTRAVCAINQTEEDHRMDSRDNRHEWIEAPDMHAHTRLRRVTDCQRRVPSRRSIMLQRAGLIVWLSVAAAVQVVSAQETTPAGDPNEQVSADASSALFMRQGFDTVARQIFHRIMAS